MLFRLKDAQKSLVHLSATVLFHATNLKQWSSHVYFWCWGDCAERKCILSWKNRNFTSEFFSGLALLRFRTFAELFLCCSFITLPFSLGFHCLFSEEALLGWLLVLFLLVLIRFLLSHYSTNLFQEFFLLLLELHKRGVILHRIAFLSSPNILFVHLRVWSIKMIIILLLKSILFVFSLFFSDVYIFILEV